MISKLENKANVKFAVASVLLAILSITTFALVQANVAGMLGISASSAGTIVTILNTYGAVTLAFEIIGVVTGVGSIGSAFAASILYILKKEGKAKAVAF